MTAPRLELESVTKTYSSAGTRVRVLRSVSLTVGAGEIAWVDGPSGSGKSSLINVAGLLTPPSSGSVRIDGRDLGAAPEREVCRARAAGIGMVFQSHNLVPELTALENVLLAAISRESAARAEPLLHEVGLERLVQVRAKRLSGGQQQRVAIARALVNDPGLVLADEPISGLDADNAEVILRVLTSAASRGCGVVVSSHDRHVGAIATSRVDLEFGARVERNGAGA